MTALNAHQAPAKRWIKSVKQEELVECGLACFVMIANFHGCRIRLADVREVVPSLARGTSLATLSMLSEHFGFESNGYQLRAHDLDQVALPLVLHWDDGHFVVLEALTPQNAHIHDPKGVSRWIDLDELDRRFSGFAFEIRPTTRLKETFKHKPNDRSYLWSHAREMKPKIILAVLLTLVLQLSALATPFFAQIAIDQAFPRKDHELLWLVASAFVGVLVANGAVSYIRLDVIRRIGATFSAGIASHITQHLFRLPIAWFRKREPGGVLSKIQMVLPVKHALSEDLPSIVVNAALACFTFLMMVYYSPTLSAIGVVAVVVYGFARAILAPRQQSALSEMIEEIGKEQALLIGTLQCMRSIRLACREDEQHHLWNEAFGRFVSAERRYKNWADRHATFQTVVLTITSLAALSVAIDYAMRGTFSLGMVFSFTAYLSLFLNAGVGVIDKYSSLKELGTYLEGLADIMGPQQDSAFADPPRDSRALRGQLELRGVSFRYGVESPNVLENISLTIQAGESVAITGPSGGGKSTLAQIMLGLNRPTSGSVLVDGNTLDDFGYQNYYKQIAAVLQDEGLFSGTVLENITMLAKSADMEFVRTCAQAAAIVEEIEAWPMAYRTLVGDAGMALSSGQRQRILLARALHCRPRILVMDEATAHLDSRRERQVSAAIRNLGITRIIFAHRKETIVGADRILLLDRGTISSMTRESVESLFA